LDRNSAEGYLNIEKQLYSGEIRHGIWAREFRSAKGSLPNAFEGAAAVTVGKSMYVFGGFSTNFSNDFRQFNRKTYVWTHHV